MNIPPFLLESNMKFFRGCWCKGFNLSLAVSAKGTGSQLRTKLQDRAQAELRQNCQSAAAPNVRGTAAERAGADKLRQAPLAPEQKPHSRIYIG